MVEVTSNAIIVLRRKDPIESLKPPGLLLLLGLPKEAVYFRSVSDVRAGALRRRKYGLRSRHQLVFWERGHGELLDLLRKAKKFYLSKMKEVHPDVVSGKDGEAVKFNQIWNRLKQLYRNHGLY